jgi:PAS domain S-box-containing protein
VLTPAADDGPPTEHFSEAAVAVDAIGVVTECNAAAGDLLRTDPASLVGRPVEFLIPDRFRTAHRKAFARYLETGGGSIVGKEPVRMFARRGDGTEIDVEITLRALGHPGEDDFCFVAAMRDATASVRQPVLSRFLEAIVAASPDGVLAVSPDRRILAVNKQFQRMWGLSDEVVGIGGPSPALSREQLSQVVDPDGFEAALRWGHQHPDQPQILDVPLLDGRIIEGYGAPLVDDEGDYLGRVWYLHDATERRTAEAQRAALTDRLAVAERSQRFLLDAADALARASGFRESLQSLAEVAVPTLGDLCLIDFRDEGGRVIRMAAAHADPTLRQIAAQLREWPPDPDGGHPSAVVMRERRSMWSTETPPDFLASISRSAEHLRVIRQVEPRSYMSVPLIAGDLVLGATTFISAGSGRVFGPDDLSLAEDLAGRMAVVVAKERRYDRERDAAHTLQANLLPVPVPAIPGVELAVRYLSGTRDAEVGGDFYDVSRMPTGEVAIVVGDVAGHDMIAAAQMAQLRGVFRALRRRTAGPAELIADVQELWNHLGLERLVTAVFARVEPHTGRLRIASAGHPVPAVVSAGGEAWFPDLEPAPPLGSLPGRPPATWEATLGYGDALVLYTDGLIESPDRDVSAGMSALGAAVSAAGTTEPDALVEEILAAMTTEDRSDDVALVVLRRSRRRPGSRYLAKTAKKSRDAGWR